MKASIGRAVCVALLTIVFLPAPVAAHDMEGLGHPSMQMPKEINHKALDRLSRSVNLDENARSVLAKLLLWTRGQKLIGCFMDGTAGEKAAVVRNTDDLLRGRNVNITIDFGTTPDYRACAGLRPAGDVRVSFATTCCAAAIGTYGHAPVFTNKSTVDLQGLLSKSSEEVAMTVMHEMLHVLGLEHEHKSPAANCEVEFNKDLIRARYTWSEETYQRNMQRLNRDESAYKWSEFDPLSIMKYFFRIDELKSGRNSPCYTGENTMPSATDYKALVDAYAMAPEPAPTERPRSLRLIGNVSAPQAVNDLAGALLAREPREP